MTERSEIVNVRYMVDDVDAAVAFYTKFLDFETLTNFAPAFADVVRGNLRLLLSGPTSSAGRPMPDGAKPGPGGWNRIHLIVDDIDAEVARLRAAGARFRNDILAGPGGKQILLQDPSGNVVELFQPAAARARGDSMAKRTLPTPALLACGAVAGPLYVTVTMAQALTRDGFDLRQHRFSWLTTGDLGWIHQSNMLLVGVLTLLLAVGVRQMLRTGPGAAWGPRLLGLFGVAYFIGGLFTADPVSGFPPGTTPEMVEKTWQGAVQNASRGASSLLLVAASLAIARWFVAEGRRGWAWFYATAIPLVFAALTAVGFAIGGNPVAVAFLMTPWIWVTALAVHLHRLAATRR
jgi:catechol 2,3-dioxygenase-like lactoylglutathione lyase family enzyme